MNDSNHSPTPWKFEQITAWPFGGKIMAGDKCIVHDYAIAHCSSQRTIEECMNAVGFRDNEKERVKALLQEQLANWKFIVRACNAHEALLEACKNFAYGRKEARECEAEMLAAIAKAESK